MMTVSHRKRLPVVPLLPDALDKPVNMAASRNASGDFFEEATAALFHGRRLVTDCNCEVCPDVEILPNVYAESKSIGNNGSAIIYTHRRDKDLRFMEANKATLVYAFWLHSFPVKEARYVSELRKGLADTAACVCLVSAHMVHKHLAGKTPRVLNTKTKTPNGKRLGYGTNGYGMGWSIPYTRLMCWTHVWGRNHFPVYDHQINVIIRTTAETAAILRRIYP